MSDLVLAIDIGGTKLDAALVNEHGELLSRCRRATPKTTDPAVLWSALAEVTRAALDVDGNPPRSLVSVGVACGGPMDAVGKTVSPLHLPAWQRFRLTDALAELVARPCFVDNDAKALTLGEGWVGAARGVANYLGLVVSTGVGGGIVLNGRLLDGALGNAGHLGHVIVEPQGHACGCGAVGCLEAETSGTAIAQHFGMAAADAPLWVRERAGHLVGRAVASVANLLDLRLAVAAGSVALGYGADFFNAAQKELDRNCRLSFSRGCVICPAGRGDEAPLLGAAAVGWRGLGRDPLTTI